MRRFVVPGREAPAGPPAARSTRDRRPRASSSIAGVLSRDARPFFTQDEISSQKPPRPSGVTLTPATEVPCPYAIPPIASLTRAGPFLLGGCPLSGAPCQNRPGTLITLVKGTS